MLGIFITDEMEEMSKSECSAIDLAENEQSNITSEDGGSQHSKSQNFGYQDDQTCTKDGNVAAQSLKATAVGSDMFKTQSSNDFLVDFDEFSFPSARLIRRMRRCERRMLPYLDEWMVVDAVLTSHELILFEVPNNDTPLIEDLESAPDNVTSLNGCKGLRLCDVAKGRNVVSQFELDDVDFVSIERQFAIPGDGDLGGIEEHCKSDLVEFWQGGTSSKSYEVLEMNKRWGHVDEDRLKIHFACGTLYLRFVVDLKDMESKNTTTTSLAINNDAASNEGKGSILWCRTIAR